MNKDANNIKNYSAEDMRRYWSNEMSAAEMHALEKAAMDDPFLADALEGFSKLQKEPAEDLALLKEKLNARAAATRVVPLKSAGIWWKVAAAIIVIAGLSTATYMFMNDRKSNLAATENQRHDSVAPASANAQPAIPAPDTSHGSVAYAAPTGRQKSGNPGEERKSVLHNHLAGKVLSRDSAAYAAVDHNQSSSLEQNKPAAPVAAMAKKENDNEVKLKNSEPAAVSKAAGARDNDALLSPAGTSLNTFSGKVVDIQNRGVPNAVVMMNNNKKGTYTDQNGFFQLQSKDTVADISINSVGFNSVNLKLNSNQSGLITLDKSNASLQEVVVQGYGKTSQKKQPEGNKDLKVYVMDAEPVIGWDKYNQYLDSNKRIPQHTTPQTGEVVLSFKVNHDGDLSSFNVEQSLSKPYDSEAIRLVKEGPAWKITKGKKTRVKLIVHF